VVRRDILSRPAFAADLLGRFDLRRRADIEPEAGDGCRTEHDRDRRARVGVQRLEVLEPRAALRGQLAREERRARKEANLGTSQRAGRTADEEADDAAGDSREELIGVAHGDCARRSSRCGGPSQSSTTLEGGTPFSQRWIDRKTPPAGPTSAPCQSLGRIRTIVPQSFAAPSAATAKTSSTGAARPAT